MSEQTPHFINGRKGCYVRSDEYSQRFEPHLAIYEEIRHLSERREKAVNLREGIISKAREHFTSHVKRNYHSKENVIGDIDTTLWLVFTPLFPAYDEYDISSLSNIVKNIKLSARGVSFPQGVPEALLGGLFFPEPWTRNFSYLEVTSRGLVFYAVELGHLNQEAKEKVDDNSGDYSPVSSDIHIYASWIIGWIIFYVKYAKHLYKALGYEGPLLLRTGLERIQEREFRISLDRQGLNYERGIPLLDDSIAIERIYRLKDLSENVGGITGDIFRAIAFACGWRKAYSVDDSFIDGIVDGALSFLRWSRKDLGG